MRPLVLALLLLPLACTGEKDPTYYAASETDDDGDGWSVEDGDCDDSDPEVYPGREDHRDGIDVNCDGKDESDYDGDGYTPEEGDCDDFIPTVSPAATERCNGVDDDCDGDIDEGSGHDFFADEDQDGFGATGDAAGQACVTPEGYAPTSDDCDDDDANVNPSRPEQCDGRDNDCDGAIDENC